MEHSISEDPIKPMNLNLRESTKGDFKKNTKSRGTNMQTVLAAFVESYNDNPDKFRLTMEVVE